MAIGAGIRTTRTIRRAEDIPEASRLIREGNGTSFVLMRVRPNESPPHKRDLDPHLGEAPLPERAARRKPRRTPPIGRTAHEDHQHREEPPGIGRAGPRHRAPAGADRRHRQDHEDLRLRLAVHRHGAQLDVHRHRGPDQRRGPGRRRRADRAGTGVPALPREPGPGRRRAGRGRAARGHRGGRGPRWSATAGTRRRGTVR